MKTGPLIRLAALEIFAAPLAGRAAVLACAAALFALGTVASAAAQEGDHATALARAADAQLDFGRTYQGRWSCTGKNSAGKALRANVVLFTDKPGIHNFSATFMPAKAKEADIIEVWTWRWAYGDTGSWYAVPDSRTAGAGILYTTDGPQGGALVWKEHVAGSSARHTFEPRPDGTLLFALRDQTVTGGDASYSLLCARAKTAKT